IGEHIVTYNYTETVIMPVGTITCDYTATTPITVLAMPVANFTAPETVCVGETATLTFAGSPATGATVTWTIAENPTQAGLSATATWNETGTQGVTVNVTTDEGCSDTFTSTVGVSSASVAAPTDQSIILGSSVALPAQANSALNGEIDFTWSPISSLSCDDCATPQATPIVTTTYTVTVTDEWGCSASDAVTVEVAQENKLVIPNAFSPNGDDVNEIFHIAGNNVTEFYMAIYDRWGQRVYEIKSTNLSEGWNGLYPDGKRAELGVYVYYIDVIFADGSTEFEKGNVTLVW
ncbi:MAG TPA: gliding motility-associated C-terminal domain-containing protein, partial [Chitinophagales bacterium]|nr:gliding motility-associated C-terminal domain-containing protein [Chitinophagales bacterium]